MKPFQFKKAVQALNFFALAEKSSVMNKMKALKLIWLADRVHIRKYGRPIIYDKYFAMEYGPVASSTKDLAEENSFLSTAEREYRNKYLKSLGRYSYQSREEPDYRVFSKSDIKVMETVSMKFQAYNQWGLSDFTHDYPEWKKHEEVIRKGENSRVEMDITDFFDDPTPEKNHQLFEDTNDILNVSKMLFETNLTTEALISH